jgi:hypothetical protein
VNEELELLSIEGHLWFGELQEMDRSLLTSLLELERLGDGVSVVSNWGVLIDGTAIDTG